jgi:senataxin
MAMADGKELGIGDADIILMSKAQSPAVDSHQPHCLARVCNITRKKNIIEISYRVNVGNDLISAMVPNASLYGVKLSSITPLEREYGALVGLKYYDLCDEIVKASHHRYSDTLRNNWIQSSAIIKSIMRRQSREISNRQ